MSEIAGARARLLERGFDEHAVEVIIDHLVEADRRGKRGHGLARVGWLLSLPHVANARPVCVQADEGFERWRGAGTLGYVVLDGVCRGLVARPPERSRLIVMEQCFPTGALGLWARRIAEETGLLAVLAATSPPRLPHHAGGPPVTGTNPLAIAVPSRECPPLVTDVSMGAVTYGDVLTGRAAPEELVPFGGTHAHKAFALAVGLEALVGALAGPDPGAVLLVARPDHDVVPLLRDRAGERRLPGAP